MKTDQGDRLLDAKELLLYGGELPETGQEVSGMYAKPVNAMLRHQYRHWPLLEYGANALKTVKTRMIQLDGFHFKLQHNPGRMDSSSAKVDVASIQSRPCFLCSHHLPAEQKGIFRNKFLFLANPFPIFERHVTIPHIQHVPQRIKDSFSDALDLAKVLGQSFTLFYNGPECGASAPDHLHFQAGEEGFMPMDTEWQTLSRLFGRVLVDDDRLQMCAIDDRFRRMILIQSDDVMALSSLFALVYKTYRAISKDCLQPGVEPMLNLLLNYNNGWRLTIFPRKKHRPDAYYLNGDEQVLFSPGAVDMGGTCILPRERDFERIQTDRLQSLFQEVTEEKSLFLRLTEMIQREWP